MLKKSQKCCTKLRVVFDPKSRSRENSSLSAIPCNSSADKDDLKKGLMRIVISYDADDDLRQVQKLL